MHAVVEPTGFVRTRIHAYIHTHAYVSLFIIIKLDRELILSRTVKPQHTNKINLNKRILPISIHFEMR
jgi:hypothetical protein